MAPIQSSRLLPEPPSPLPPRGQARYNYAMIEPMGPPQVAKEIEKLLGTMESVQQDLASLNQDWGMLYDKVSEISEYLSQVHSTLQHMMGRIDFLVEQGADQQVHNKKQEEHNKNVDEKLTAIIFAIETMRKKDS